jgi:microcystin-dependent protein
MPFPPQKKDLAGVLADTLMRLDLVERRLTKSISGGGSAHITPAGAVTAFAGATAPAGWLLCVGGVGNRTTLAALFAVVGTTYGAGDGTTTFGLPDFRGRVLVGLDAAQPDFDALGETGGNKGTILQQSNLPANTIVDALTSSSNTDFGVKFSSIAAYTAKSQTIIGASGVAFSNLPPYAVANYIISTGESA